MKPISLPDGQSASLPEPQARAVWQHWRGLTPVALARGEGVRIEVTDGTVEISTVYAPQWEGVRIAIERDGTAVWCGEQSAPDYSPATGLAPWERRT